MQRTFNLDERLIRFAVAAINIAESLPGNYAGQHIASQLVRSSTSPALNYGEAQGAESHRDFIHKIRIVLKELRETYNCLRIIELKNWSAHESLQMVKDENNQLIAIFVKSISTARKRIT